MRINYKNLFNLRKLLSDPKKLFAVLIFAFVLVFVQNSIAKNPSFEARVTRVIDGDTIEVSRANQSIRIRFFGIDAPELKQSFGKQSKEALRKILEGKRVQVIQKSKDNYGRVVAVVKLGRVDVNKMMVEQGFAWAYTYYSNAYAKEQEKARKHKFGLWKENKPLEPYKWRKQNKGQG